MEIFIDTADVQEIKNAAQWGFIDGVTTNPSLMSQANRSTKECIQEIATIINGPISAEVSALNYEEMISQGRELSQIHPNVVVKIPMTQDGLRACKWFSLNKIKTNVTLVFSANQALLAAKCQATYVSPFLGRLDDIGQTGLELIDEIRSIYDNYGFQTKILSASLRHPQHVKDVALSGSDVATIPYKVLLQLFSHPLTQIGLDKFMQDYKKISATLQL